jgi:hypothetical protein
MSDLRHMSGGSERIDEIAPVISVASKMPENCVQAVQAYMVMRKDQIMAGIESAASFELDGIRHGVAALTEMMESLKVEGTEKATSIKRTRSKGKKAGEKESRESYLSHLYSVLTPPGWEENLLPPLETYIKMCRLRILEDKEAAVARAGVEESQRFRRFLANTAAAGSEGAAVMKLRRARHA